VELPDTSAAQARREGIAIANECLTPLYSKTALNLADMGRSGAEEELVGGLFSFVSLSLCGTEGRGEGLRRSHGDAAGVKLDPAPVNRWTVNVGTAVTSPSPLIVQISGGQAHRPLLVSRRGGAPVVVGGRESLSHGDGGQQTWSDAESRGGRR
jgi:hypothetical protein